MTNPVILLGTQSNGETLPVQVDATGRLVAEGLQGPPGPEGPPGEDLQLPPDPYEGAILGWLNGELAWVGSPPIPIPEGVFGPITGWDPENGLLTVEGEIPTFVAAGVRIYQCDESGRYYDGPNTNADQRWGDALSRFSLTGCSSDLDPQSICAFNGDVYTGCGNKGDGPLWQANQFIQFNNATVNLKVYCLYSASGRCVVTYDGGQEQRPRIPSGNEETAFCTFDGIRNLESITTGEAGGNNGYICAVEINGERLIDQRYCLNLRVNNVFDQNILGNINKEANFTIGKYLRIPAQRVAPWVLYGNDPTSLIDYLRST